MAKNCGWGKLYKNTFLIFTEKAEKVSYTNNENSSNIFEFIQN